MKLLPPIINLKPGAASVGGYIGTSGMGLKPWVWIPWTNTPNEVRATGSPNPLYNDFKIQPNIRHSGPGYQGGFNSFGSGHQTLTHQNSGSRAKQWSLVLVSSFKAAYTVVSSIPIATAEQWNRCVISLAHILAAPRKKVLAPENLS